jgi:hypothetical protein
VIAMFLVLLFVACAFVLVGLGLAAILIGILLLEAWDRRVERQNPTLHQDPLAHYERYGA